MVEVLKQDQYSPLPVEKQVLLIYAGGQGYLDSLEVEQVRPFEKGLYPFVENAHPAILNDIREKKTLDDDLKARMSQAIEEYKEKFLSEQAAK